MRTDAKDIATNLVTKCLKFHLDGMRNVVAVLESARPANADEELELMRDFGAVIAAHLEGVKSLEKLIASIRGCAPAGPEVAA